VQRSLTLLTLRITGYTRDFIDGLIDKEQQMNSIKEAFKAQNSVSDIMMMEGTGHIGVGSCVNANNANVAAMVGADMVLVANGGVGSAFDDLELNYTMCKANGVRVGEDSKRAKRLASESALRTQELHRTRCTGRAAQDALHRTRCTALHRTRCARSLSSIAQAHPTCPQPAWSSTRCCPTSSRRRRST